MNIYTTDNKLEELYAALVKSSRETAVEFEKLADELVSINELIEKSKVYNECMNNDNFKSEINISNKNDKKETPPSHDPTTQRILSLMENVKDIDLEISKARILFIGRRSVIVFDGAIYALLHRQTWKLIHKSLDMNEILSYYEEIERNEE